MRLAELADGRAPHHYVFQAYGHFVAHGEGDLRARGGWAGLGVGRLGRAGHCMNCGRRLLRRPEQRPAGVMAFVGRASARRRPLSKRTASP